MIGLPTDVKHVGAKTPAEAEKLIHDLNLSKVSTGQSRNANDSQAPPTPPVSQKSQATPGGDDSEWNDFFDTRIETGRSTFFVDQEMSPSSDWPATASAKSPDWPTANGAFPSSKEYPVVPPRKTSPEAIVYKRIIVRHWGPM